MKLITKNFKRLPVLNRLQLKWLRQFRSVVVDASTGDVRSRQLHHLWPKQSPSNLEVWMKVVKVVNGVRQTKKLVLYGQVMTLYQVHFARPAIRTASGSSFEAWNVLQTSKRSELDEKLQRNTNTKVTSGELAYFDVNYIISNPQK